MGIYKAGDYQSDFLHTFTSATKRGVVTLINNVLAFLNIDAAAGAEETVLFRCNVARADKKIGTGEDILRGQRLYIDFADMLVSKTKGAGMLFVGWAEEDVDGSDASIKMCFDGTFHTLY
jgi:hypothetical protein